MHSHPASRTRIPVLILAALFLTAACSSVGPRSIRTDQVDYADALSEAAKRQTLLNIVKLRYGDYPSFVSVSQLVAGYQFSGNLTLGTELLDFGSGSFVFGNDANLTAGGTFSDNPTVTYTPLTGSDFARVMLAPLPPSDAAGLILAGVPGRLVFGLGLKSIGPYRNNRGSLADETGADPEFIELVDLMADLSSAGSLTVSQQPPPSGSKEQPVQLILELVDDPGDPAVAPKLARFRALLGLDPRFKEIRLAPGIGPGRGGTLFIRTRALIEVLGELAHAVELPPNEPGAAVAIELPPRAARPGLDPGVQIRTTRLPPLHPFAAVRYAGRWFYIPADDLASKQTFTFLMLLFSLAESSKPGQLPVLTIPTG